MELYLIRHGETVDNVAGLYAGVRDSALTIHGVEQARRLGEHFAKDEVPVSFNHIFASPLSRAFKTAQALQTAQQALRSKDQSLAEEQAGTVEIVRVPELIEQDFGYVKVQYLHELRSRLLTARCYSFYEGKNFQSRKEAHREKHKDDEGFVDVESKDSLNKRADTFLEEHLISLLGKGSGPGAIAIVSHGIFLSHLWRRLLLRLPTKSVTVAPDIIANKGSIVLQHLGGWSNTGYLQLLLTPEGDIPAVDRPMSPIPTDTSLSQPTPVLENSKEKVKNEKPVTDESSSTPKLLIGWSTLIVAIDRKDHLVGLKRQRGGIGRSAHDEGQQKLTGFFKRQRTS